MKKFLTVLLVIAVMFTFSFSSTFAAQTADEAAQAKVSEEQTAMAEAMNTYKAAVVYNQKGYLASVPGGTTPVDALLNKDAVEATIAQIIADYNAKIQAAAANAVADNAFDASDATAVENAWKTDLADNAAIDKAVLTTYGAKDGVLYTKAVKDAKAAAIKEMDAVDTSLYTKEDAEKIAAAVKAQKAAVNAAENSQTGLAAIDTAVKAVQTEVKKYTPVAKQAEELAKAKTEAKNAIEAKAETFKTAEKARLETITGNASASASEIADATAKLASLDSNVAKVVSFYTDQVDAVAIDEDTNLAAAKTAIDGIKTAALADLADETEFYGLVSELASKDLLVKYAQDYGTSMKNQYDQTTGEATYNSATVDKAVADVVKKINALDTSVNTYEKIKTALASTKTAKQEKEALAGVISSAITDITTGTYAATNWADENKEAVEAVQKDYTAKIKAAADKDAVDALVKEAKAAMDKYLTTAKETAVKGDVDTAMGDLGYDTSLPAYADGVAAKDSANTYSSQTKSDAVADAKDVLYDAVLAKQDASLTNAEIKEILKANYAVALTKIDAMKPDEALKNDAKAVIDAIAALPTTATLENKDQYLAAQKKLEEYLDTAGAKIADVTNAPLLKSYMTKIIGLEKKAVEDQIKALPTTITVDDQAKVEAAKAAADAYEKAYKDYAGPKYLYGYAAIDSTVQTKLGNAETALSNAKKTDAAKKIAAIPAGVTAADKAAVEAARKAYDALTDEEKEQFDTASKPLVEKLLAAEKTLAAQAVENVQKVQITASSSAVKGAITVKWTFKGSKSSIKGFQIWRSTKKSSGFKKMITTSKYSYKNTKALKKGVRYYYKVRAYNRTAEGKLVFSDWSNKAYRIAQ